jgi:hypothetical protein
VDSTGRLDTRQGRGETLKGSERNGGTRGSPSAGKPPAASVPGQDTVAGSGVASQPTETLLEQYEQLQAAAAVMVRPDAGASPEEWEQLRAERRRLEDALSRRRPDPFEEALADAMRLYPPSPASPAVLPVPAARRPGRRRRRVRRTIPSSSAV